MVDGMTIKQIAELCRVSVKTVRRWAAKSEEKPSGRVRQNVVGGLDTLSTPTLDTLSTPLPDIKRRMIEAGEVGEAIVLTLPETLSLIRRGRAKIADLLASNAALLAQNAAQTARLQALEARPLALPGPVNDPATIHDVRYLAESGRINNHDARRLLGLDDDRYAPPRRPKRHELTLVGTYESGLDRLAKIQWWPCSYRTFALYLGVGYGVPYRSARYMGLDPYDETLTAEQARSMWASISLHVERRAEVAQGVM